MQLIVTTRRRRLLNLIGTSIEVCVAGDIVTAVLSPVIFPLSMVVLLLFASSRPRAELLWTRESFDLKLTPDRGPGWSTERYSCAAREVECFRRNKFARALYLRITKLIDTDVLGDLDEENFEALVEEIERAPTLLAHAVGENPPSVITQRDVTGIRG